MSRTAIAAHRGGALEWPENSRRAFRACTALPVELVELDVHRTRDGVLVVHHDATLERTTDGQGVIAALDWAEVGRARLRGAPEETVPTLDEVLAILAPSRLRLRLEVKAGPDHVRYPGIEAEIAARLEAHGLLARTLLTSFYLPVLADWPMGSHPLERLWLLAPLVAAATGGLRPLARLARAQGVHRLALPIEAIDPSMLEAAAEAEIELSAYGVHEEAQIAKALALGLATFTTDRPSLALALRAAREAGRLAEPSGVG